MQHQHCPQRLWECYINGKWVNTFLRRWIQLSYLALIKFFCLPISVTWLVHRNVSDEESSFGTGLKGMYTSSVSLEWRSHEPTMSRRVPIMTEIFQLSSEMSLKYDRHMSWKQDFQLQSQTCEQFYLKKRLLTTCSFWVVRSKFYTNSCFFYILLYFAIFCVRLWFHCTWAILWDCIFIFALDKITAWYNDTQKLCILKQHIFCSPLHCFSCHSSIDVLHFQTGDFFLCMLRYGYVHKLISTNPHQSPPPAHHFGGLVVKVSAWRAGVCLFVCCLLNVPATWLVYLRDRSAQTILPAATLR